ncbi:MAG TPA: metal-dependent phosphohydrolase [Planctomycetaceae bacterium]|nr:metal-dependent phosphohydrolase [Planctomycetaceae bacterium]
MQTRTHVDANVIAKVWQHVEASIPSAVSPGAGDAGHGLDHIRRVEDMACRLAAEHGGNLYVIRLASLLHDVGDAKFNNGQELSGRLAMQWLSELNVSAEVIKAVVEIVDQISFRHQTPANQLSHEAKIVQDADRLDAIGAVGIIRTIEYGASRGRPFYSADGTACTLSHFFEKLLRLRGLLHTPLAIEIATDREALMLQFLDQYCQQCGLELDDIKTQFDAN